METSKTAFQTFLVWIIFLVIHGGCGSERQLTKEEQRLNKMYHREPVEDREYYFKTAGFSVRPVQTPFVRTYIKTRSSDGVEFISDFVSNIRDPRYYVGRLSTYFFNTGLYDSLNVAVSNIKALVENCQTPYKIKVIEDSLQNYSGYLIHKFRWTIVDGGTFPVNSYSKDAQMIGAVVETEKGTYLVTLVENDIPTYKYTSWTPCLDGAEAISAKDATAMMEERFQQFLQGIHFDID